MVMGTERGSGVEVHSVLTVVSSTPVKPGTISPVGPFDHAMGQHSLHVILYYRISIAFEKIRPALNEILSFCPNLTGRLYKNCHGNWEIKCNDAGIRVFLAKVGTSVDEWLRSASPDDEHHLTASNDLPDDPQFWSPFRIQVTEFEGGGTSIAITCQHMLADPTSLTTVIKSWSETHLNQPIVNQPYFLPLAFHRLTTTTTTTATASSAFYAAKSKADQPSVRMAGATFCFSDSVVNRSLSEVSSSLPDASPFDILAALFLTRVAILRNRTIESICISLDIRKRLDARLPYGYFGNALHFSQLNLKFDGGDLSHVAGLVQRHVSGLKEEDFRSAIEWFESRKDEEGKFDPSFRMYGPELTCVNMEHMIAPVGTHSKECEPLMYMASFEKNEKPVHVSYRVGNSEGEGLIMVMPSPGGGLARRVAVTLPEDEMEKLLQDEIILSLKPSLLLRGRK